VGMLWDISVVQPMLMDFMKDNPDIAATSIYTNNGFILSSSIPQNIGMNSSEMGFMFGEELESINRAIYSGGNYLKRGFSPGMNRNMEIAAIHCAKGNKRKCDYTHCFLRIV